MWGSFLMAPWVGHLSNGQLLFRDETYRLPPNWGRHAVHGLVASEPWELRSADDGEVCLERRLGPPWPFGGIVRQLIRLDESGITMRAEVEAERQPMPAALGWHPWFRRPDAGDLSVGVAADRLLHHDGELPTGQIEPVRHETDLRMQPRLADRRIDAVYVDATSPAVLTTPAISLRMTFDPLISTIVVYSPAEAVCVEPWSSWPDAHRLAASGLSTGLVELEPGEKLSRWTRWEWDHVGS
jgi:aldose 1-epimerase